MACGFGVLGSGMLSCVWRFRVFFIELGDFEVLKYSDSTCTLLFLHRVLVQASMQQKPSA